MNIHFILSYQQKKSHNTLFISTIATYPHMNEYTFYQFMVYT